MTLDSSNSMRDSDSSLAADLVAFAAPASASGLAGRALASSRPAQHGSSPMRDFLGDWKHAAALGAVGFLLLVVVVGIALPSVGSSRGSVSSRALESVTAAKVEYVVPSSPPAGDALRGMVGEQTGRRSTADDASGRRQVIRTADLDVRVANGRDAYASASSLVREDLGEFVSQTNFSGVEPYTAATVTLRVNADRIQSVLQSLRALGEVASESTGGEDVTDQMVDLDARLRNERRIEQELLTLLETRKDAPLEDILKVRDHLGRIRESIERLAAQQAKLANRVALATITARLSAKSEPIARREGVLDYLGSELSAAWRCSIRALIDTVSFLLAVIVGGLIWWIILGGMIFAIRRWWRRRQRRLAVEPPPVI